MVVYSYPSSQKESKLISDAYQEAMDMLLVLNIGATIFLILPDAAN